VFVRISLMYFVLIFPISIQVRKLMSLLKYSLPKLHAYECLCKEMGKKAYAPVVDVATRWNSTYGMLVRAMQMREVCCALAIGHSMKHN
jgi:hypothetical protein